MTPEQWISALEKTYELYETTLTEEKKQILLTQIKVSELEFAVAKLKADNLMEANKTPTNQDIQVCKAMVIGGIFSLGENIPEEYRSTSLELEDILVKEFFRKVSNGETFGDEGRIEASAKALFERYHHSHRPFINMSRTFLTFTNEVNDLFPAYYNLIVSQILNSVLTDIRGIFFPSEGPFKHSLKDRIKAQGELLERYAPTFDRQGFLKNNPVLEKLRAEEPKWPGVVYIIICLVLAGFVPQERWWGKILFWVLMGIIGLCLCGIFPIFQRIIFGKTHEEIEIEHINRKIRQSWRKRDAKEAKNYERNSGNKRI